MVDAVCVCVLGAFTDITTCIWAWDIKIIFQSIYIVVNLE